MPINPQILPITPNGRDAAAVADLRRRVAVLERGSSGGGSTTTTVADATTVVKGKLQLGGDFGSTSTAAAPVIDKAKGNFRVKGPRPYVDVMHPDYGAIPDPADAGWATSDIGAVVNAAIAALPSRGGVILLPEGRLRQTTTILVDKPVAIRGAGVSANIFDGNSWDGITELRWAGSAGGTMVKVVSPVSHSTHYGGFELDGFVLNGQGSASIGFNFFHVRNGKIGTLGVHRLALASGSIGYDFNTDGMTFATTDVDTTADTITEAAHGLVADQTIRFISTGTLPAGLATGTTYYVKSPTTDNFQVAASAGGVAINLTSQGSGTHTVVPLSNTMFVHADHLLTNNCATAVAFRGMEGDGVPINSCHNTISVLSAHYGISTGTEAAGPHGIVFASCDNNYIAFAYLSKFGGSTAYAVEFQDDARSNTIAHLQPDGGAIARTPQVANQDITANRIEYYDRENGQIAPVVQPQATLFWREGGRNAGGEFVNVSSATGSSVAAAAANSGFYTHKVQGTTGAEYFVETRSNSGKAEYRAQSKDSGGTVVIGAFNTDGANAQVALGSLSNHEMLFRQNSATIFKLSGGHARFASGKRIGYNLDPVVPLDMTGATIVSGEVVRLPNAGGIYAQNAAASVFHHILSLDASDSIRLANDGRGILVGGQITMDAARYIGFGIFPTARLHFAAATQSDLGIAYGTDALTYRIAAGLVRHTEKLDVTTSAANVTSVALGAKIGVHMDGTSGALHQTRSGTGLAYSLYSAVGNTNPIFTIANAASDIPTLRFGTTSAMDTRLSRPTANTLRIDNNSTGAGHLEFLGGGNIIAATTTGTKIGTAGGPTGQMLGFFNAAPITQPVAIAAPILGAVIDIEARTAINLIRVALTNLGLTA